MRGTGQSREEKIKIPTKKKIAFVCSGGATKAGAFHLGVALALQEQGFKFFGGVKPQEGKVPEPGPMDISAYVGSSAGSIISSYLAAGYSLDNIFNSFLGKHAPEVSPQFLTPKVLPRLTYSKMFKLRTNIAPGEQLGQLAKLKHMFTDVLEGNWEALIQFRWLKMSGFFSTSGVEQYMREEVLPSNRFSDYLADLFIVGTQLNHSKKVIFSKHSYEPPPHDLACHFESDVSISDACAASTALPVVFSPYPIQTRGQLTYYIDGEIRDTLSTHVAADCGADLVFSSYTHQPIHILNDPAALLNLGLPAIIIQSIYLVIEQKINHHIHNKKIQRNAILAVSNLCKQEGLSDSLRHKICTVLEKELYHRLEVDMIYIHPRSSDKQMFFGEHFSLSPNKMREIVRCGFRSAIEVLNRYDFKDRQKKPALGSVE